MELAPRAKLVVLGRRLSGSMKMGNSNLKTIAACAAFAAASALASAATAGQVTLSSGRDISPLKTILSYRDISPLKTVLSSGKNISPLKTILSSGKNISPL